MPRAERIQPARKVVGVTGFEPVASAVMLL
jgi:hypothetical protein